MKRLLIALAFIALAGPAFATCPTPITVKDAAGATQNFTTVLDGSGNCESVVSVTDTIVAPATLTSVNQTLAINTNGQATANIHISANTNVTLAFQALAADGVTWVAKTAFPLAGGAGVTAIIAGGTGDYAIYPAGSQQVRAIVTLVGATPTVTVSADASARLDLTALLLSSQAPLAAGTALIGSVGISPTPIGAVFVNVSSANQANANAVTTIPAVANKTNYLTGFELIGGGSTTGGCVVATVAGLLGGTLNYAFCAATGALLPDQPLIAEFTTPLPASTQNVAIVVTLPALGSGNTNATAVAHGFYQ